MVAKSAELQLGRTFAITLDDGDDFFESLASFCKNENITSGYIPMFIGAFRNVRVAGTCESTSGERPMFDKFVEVQYAETVGGGTLAFDHESGELFPHVHLSIGRRLQGADGLTSHLISAEIQFLLEMVLVEVTSPNWTRPRSPDLYDIPLLTFN